jgi:mono/diheme cytochrome c family protein
VIGARSKSPLLLAAGVLAATILAGCSTREPDLENGRKLFVAQCATCHALTEAQAAAEIGPDLDAAFAESRAAGMDSDTIAGVVEAQIDNPRTVDPSDTAAYMPADLVEGNDADDVAAYVGSVAGVPGVEAPEFESQSFFTTSCSGCHTLAAVGAVGTVGPNLDESLADKDLQYVIEGIIDPEATIADGFGPGVMPDTYEEQLSPDQVEQLAQFILDSVGSS